MIVRSTQPTSRKSSRCAFTLVELLVVIGIIALLISILLPALNKARQSANSTKCMANLKSIGQAMFLYTTTYKGSLPFGFVPEALPGSPLTFEDNVTKYVGPREDWSSLLLSVITSDRTNSQYMNASTSQAGARALFLCPEVSIEAKGTDRLAHYAPHPLLMPDIRKLSNYLYIVSGTPRVYRTLKPYKINKIRRPAEIAGLFDSTQLNDSYGAYATADCINGYAMNGPVGGTYLVEDYARTSPAQNADTPVNMKPTSDGAPQRRNGDFENNRANIRFRHMGDTKTNALMMDGHVESFVYRKDKPDNDCTDMKLRNICVPPPMK